MYKYKCSKKDCGNTWTVQEGCLNGFTLTCPACGKGRGLFEAQMKNSESESAYKEKGENNNTK